MAGWIKLHRSLLKSAVFDDPQLLKLWLWCLLKATHTPRETVIEKQLVKLEPGQFPTGRFKLEEEFNRGTPKRKRVSAITLWRWLKKLEEWQMLNIKTHSKFSIVTVSNWSEYQQDEQQMNNRRTTDEQQVNTDKNVKNEKNEKKYSSQVYDLLAYWNEKNIVVHRETDNTLKQIQRGLKKHPLNDIKKAIDRYAIIYSDSNYFYKHKWTLPKFLSQQNGVPDFLDEGIRWINYKQEAQNNKPSRPLKFYIPEDDNANSEFDG